MYDRFSVCDWQFGTSLQAKHDYLVPSLTVYVQETSPRNKNKNKNKNKVLHIQDPIDLMRV